MSNPCETCPLLKGLPPPSELLEVCGIGTPQCMEYREVTAQRMEALLRQGRIAEVGSGRVLDLRLLQPGDHCDLAGSGSFGVPYRPNSKLPNNYQICLDVRSITSDGGAQVSVVKDFFHQPSEGDFEWPIPEEEELVIRGSCPSRTPSRSDSPSYSEEGHAAGMLHVGRLVVLERGEGIKFCTMILQDVRVIDPTGVSMMMFSTYPSVFRPPVLESS